MSTGGTGEGGADGGGLQLPPESTTDWRFERRPTPWLNHALAAGTGVIAASGVLLLAGETLPDDGDNGALAAVISAAMVIVAYAVWRLVPSVVRSALVSTIVLGILATFAFLIFPEVDAFSDVRPFFIFTILGWGAAFLFGPARGRVVLLALALVLSWAWITTEVGEPETAFAPLTYALPFPFSPFTYGYYGYSEDSVGSSTVCDSSGNCTFSDEFSSGDDFAPEPTFPGATDPPFGETGAVSMLFGLGYFAAVRLLDRSGRHGLATTFPVPGAIAVVVGLILLGVEWDELWLIAAVTIAVGCAVGWTAMPERRRFTTWFGALTATVGTFLFAGDLTDKAVDLDGSNGNVKAGLAFLLFGVVGTIGALVLGRLLGEPDNGDEAGDEATTSPAPPPLPS